MALNATYFSSYNENKKTLNPIRVNRIEFNVFLYISNANQCHCHYATFYYDKQIVCQYNEKYIAFSDFMDALFQYSAEDEISVELPEWESQNNSGYHEKKYREAIWEYISTLPFFIERINDLAYAQVESWREQIGILKGHSTYVEEWHNYFNGLFNIESEANSETKNGQSKLEESWDSPDYAG